MIVFHGNDRFAYRDPACCFVDNTCCLFFTLSEKDGDFLYNRLAMSRSTDLKNWSEPVLLTDRDLSTNYCSPGNVLRQGDDYVLCFTSYPMPFPLSERWTGDETARLFTMRTKDFVHFSQPQLLNPKGDLPQEALGRMIDPFIFEHDSRYYLFFKQNGVSLSTSEDLVRWDYQGHTDCGENACVLRQDDEFLLIHSPQNGIAFSRSNDLLTWRPAGLTTLGQSNWPWAEDRITAGFAMEAPEWTGHRYVLFFHGSRNVYPETHGNATLAAVFTDDFITFHDDF
jgi:hypothetical protein